jgi:protein-S-isoprenylcysteine O-methyltransferase Ste14
MVRRALVLGYGMVAYLIFLATLLVTIGFLADVGPKGVDDGPAGSVWAALLVDLGLLSLFAVQHSVMARPWFKRWWTGIIPQAIERSTYVLAASLVVVLLLWQWRPLPDPVWSVSAGWARALLWTGYLLGWAVLVLSTFLIGHFDLFGLKQVLAEARERRYAEPDFHEPLLYRLVRNPLMVGFLIAFWVVPDMSVGRLLFVGVATAYILVGVRLEEHDLKRQLGEPYERYLRRVPRFVPRPSTLVGSRATAGSVAADPEQ